MNERDPVWFPARAKIAFLLSTVAALLLVLLSFQELPGLSPSTHVSLSDAGYAQCIDNGWNQGLPGCDANLGQPLGAVRVFGLPVDIAAAVVGGGDDVITFDDVQLVYAFFTVLSFFGAMLFFRMLAKSWWLGLLGAALYLIGPIVSQQGSYGALRVGYALLPTYLLIDSRLLAIGAMRPARIAGVVALVIAVRVFALLCDGYSFVMSSGIALALFLASGLAMKKWRDVLVAAPLYAVACGIAYVLYFMVVPGGSAGLGAMPIDFFRSQGVDLYTVLVPSPIFWLYEASGLAFDVKAGAAFGDGSNIAFNFVGYVFLVSVLVIVTGRLLVRRSIGVPLLALSLAAAGAFILSLGPSLKFKSFDDTRNDSAVSFRSYLMPKEKALLSLGTDRIYQSVPGIKNIRVLARWQNVVHFALVAFFVAFVQLLVERKRKALVVMAVIFALVESLPNMTDMYTEGIARRAEAEAIKSDYLAELLRMTTKGEKTVMMQLHDKAESNHYLVDYLCPKADLRCYNIGGDKAFEIARDGWPQEVEALFTRRNIEGNVRELFRTKAADVIVVPLFDLRRLAYSRVAAGVDEDQVRSRVDALFAGGGYLRENGRFFISLRPAPDLLSLKGCGTGCWNDWPAEPGEGKVAAWGPQRMESGKGFNRQINGRSAFWAKVNDPDRYTFAFGGILLPTLSGAGVVSAQLPLRVEKTLLEGKTYNVTLIDAVDSKKITLGQFEVISSKTHAEDKK